MGEVRCQCGVPAVRWPLAAGLLAAFRCFISCGPRCILLHCATPPSISCSHCSPSANHQSSHLSCHHLFQTYPSPFRPATRARSAKAALLGFPRCLRLRRLTPRCRHFTPSPLRKRRPRAQENGRIAATITSGVRTIYWPKKVAAWPYLDCATGADPTHPRPTDLSSALRDQ